MVDVQPLAAPAPLRRVLVCGSGLAAAMTIASLARALPQTTELAWLETGHAAASDLFYGSVTTPTAYAFNLAAGVEEPSLILSSEAAFSWGTRYTGWGGASWTQAFALPFPVIDGVVFHHHLAAAGTAAVEPFLIGAAAAARGAFAHPPRGPGETARHPLARAEYGYQIDPAGYARLFVAAFPPGRVVREAGDIAEVTASTDAITGIALADGRTLTADLYIDCTGPDALILSGLEPAFARTRRVAMSSETVDGQSDWPLRMVTATDTGWRSDTPLHGHVVRHHVFDPVDPAPGTTALGEVTLGRRDRAWAGNCVGIGHAACVAEPLTPSPMLLLERDIERLLTLLPDRGDMGVERREYNRRFADDADHAALFDRALFAAEDLPAGAYWQAARATAVPDKLARKLAMFADRGLLVAYDLEPYHPEDWTILHFGMGRRPARPDRLAGRAPREQVAATLAGMRRDIDKVAATLPPAAPYRSQFMTYLRRKQG